MNKKKNIEHEHISRLNMLLLYITLVSIGLSSCGQYEVLEHNKQVKKSVDSLYRVKRDSLVKYADSICNSNYNQYLDNAYDSILQIRTKEIEKLIDQ